MIPTDILKDVFVFKGLSNDELKQVASICTIQKFKKGELVFSEGSEATDIFIIHKGVVSIDINMPPSMDKLSVKVIKKGEIFGELSFIDSSPRSASARCIEDSELIVFDQSAFRNLGNVNNHLKMVVMDNISSILSERLRYTNYLLKNAIVADAKSGGKHYSV